MIIGCELDFFPIFQQVKSIRKFKGVVAFIRDFTKLCTSYSQVRCIINPINNYDLSRGPSFFLFVNHHFQSCVHFCPLQILLFFCLSIINLLLCTILSTIDFEFFCLSIINLLLCTFLSSIDFGFFVCQSSICYCVHFCPLQINTLSSLGSLNLFSQFRY